MSLSDDHLLKLREGTAAWNTWRETSNIREPLLRGADLRGFQLSNINLTKCDLTDVLFDGAVLDGANLQDATLTGSSFSKNCSLRNANFSFSRADRCGFTGAVLMHTCFKFCNLSDARFCESHLHNVDLSCALL